MSAPVLQKYRAANSLNGANPAADAPAWPPELAPGAAGPFWGVWIHGAGWLRAKAGGDAFASLDRALAEAAAELYAGADWPARCKVAPIDQSMTDLEPVFLAQEAVRLAAAKSARTAWDWLCFWRAQAGV